MSCACRFISIADKFLKMIVGWTQTRIMKEFFLQSTMEGNTNGNI
jgi:hypothetical protein